MTSLYVDRKGVELRVESDTLIFAEEGKRVACIPLQPLERVFLRGDVTLKASVLGRLGAKGIGVVVMSGRKGEATMLMPRPHNDAARRMAQYKVALDKAPRLAFARRFVVSKATRQAELLSELANELPTHRHELSAARGRVEAACESAAHATALASLRGAEGAAAQAHFAGLQAVFAPSLNFNGRNRRPPRDPVNAVLSLGYTMLHAECVLQLYGAGLDPFIGFLHELDFGRESLACDLAEPRRPAVDRFVHHLFRSGELEAAHFVALQGACLLGKAGRAHFYAAWAGAASDLRRELADDVAALCRALASTGLDSQRASDLAPMAWLLTYDVADSKRLQRIHRCVQHHAMPLQYSVFWLHGSTQARDACLAEVLPLLRNDSDDLRAYALPDRGFRLRLGAPALPGGIVWSALPGEWWNSNLEAGEKDDDGS